MHAFMLFLFHFVSRVEQNKFSGVPRVFRLLSFRVTFMNRLYNVSSIDNS